MPEKNRLTSESIRGYSKHIFWSYKPGVSLAPAQVIKQVIAYGEVSDLVKLSKMFPTRVIHKALLTWKEKDRFERRINFMEKVILSK
jgi:hypothetical protein